MQEAGVTRSEDSRHPRSKAVRDGDVVGERAEHEIGEERDGDGGDLHGHDGVVAVGARDHRNAEDRAQAQRRRHSNLANNALGAPLRLGNSVFVRSSMRRPRAMLSLAFNINR
jgi:hypothetical protein